MKTENKTFITVQNEIQAPIEKVWKFWNEPTHIKNWAFATDEWHAPAAENDLKTGGKFKTTMAAKDGSMSFDFEGIYRVVKEHERIEYEMADGRYVEISFSTQGGTTKVVESFEPEGTHSHEMQQGGWQAILDNFKKYVESSK